MTMTTQTTTTEALVSMPILNPETGSPMRSMRYAGKIDRIEGNRLIDWKTVSDPRAWAKQNALSFQAELYALAYEHAHGAPIHQIEYRLIQRPGIKLCGKDASPEAYEERVYRWIVEHPGALSSEHVMVNQAKKDAAMAMLHQAGKRILENRKAARWLPNSQACTHWGRECEYMPLCLAIAHGGDPEAIVEESFTGKPINTELGGAEGLTYSATRELALCERRFYWRYERGLVPADEREGEALHIGNLVHMGLEHAGHGVDFALSKLDELAGSASVIGEAAWKKHDEMRAKARAMVRAAHMFWVAPSQQKQEKAGAPSAPLPWNPDPFAGGKPKKSDSNKGQGYLV